MVNLDGLIIVIVTPIVGYGSILTSGLFCLFAWEASREGSSRSDKAWSYWLAVFAGLISTLGMLLIGLSFGRDFPRAFGELFRETDKLMFFLFSLPIFGTALSIPLSFLFAYILFKRIRRSP